MKRGMCVLLIFCLGLFCPACITALAGDATPGGTPPTELVAYGDVNFDRRLGADDALLVLKETVEKITLDSEQRQVADVDRDNEITAADALLILRKVVDS